jgi:DNA-binding response OmpR family regulator
MIPDTIAILLIEDDDQDEFLMRNFLTTSLKSPFRITRTIRLAEGLDALGTEAFDIVIMDLGLPDSQGLDTFLRVQEKSPNLPVIVLTGNDNDEVATQAVHRGAQDFLVKGQVTGNLVARSIRYAIERKKLLAQVENSLKEIKVLQGLLPICMNCKKIRDDQGVWTQMEAYISTHSNAEFSHGLCSECAAKLYPRYMKKEDK